MSGSRRVAIPADPDGVLERLVGGIATFSASPVNRWALVGGVSVMVHLAEAHRSTRDVDTVVHDDAGELAAAIVVLGGKEPAGPIILADGTKIDVIPTGTWTPDGLPDDDLDRAFILSHWWAVDTAENLEVVVTAGGAVVAEAAAPVAQPAAVVAAKLQSMRGRLRDPAKAASDIYDVYRLLVAHDRDGAVAAALATAPVDLGAWCAGALAETMVSDADRSARRLLTHARGPAMGGVSAADLDVVGSLCIERLRRCLNGPAG